MKKNIWTICLAGFFTVIIIATLIGENVYYDSLPSIEKTLPAAAHLTASYSVTASVVYGRQEHMVRADHDFSAITLLLHNGASVWEGLPIYRVSLPELRLAIKTLAASVLALQKQNEELAALDAEGTDYTLNELLQEINLLQMELLNEKMENLNILYENDGIAYSDYSGHINYAVIPNAPVSSGQEIATIAVDTGARFITWQMPAAEGEHMAIGGLERSGTVGGSIEATLLIKQYFDLNGTDVPATMPKDYVMMISQMEFNPQSGVYDFWAPINDKIELMMADGATVEGICRYKSREQYDFVIPTNAIKFDSDMNGTVFVLRKRERIYGEEYYVEQIAVEAERILNHLTALKNASLFYEIVTLSDKPLADKMAVKIAAPTR